MALFSATVNHTASISSLFFPLKLADVEYNTTAYSSVLFHNFFVRIINFQISWKFFLKDVNKFLRKMIFPFAFNHFRVPINKQPKERPMPYQCSLWVAIEVNSFAWE